MKVLILIILLLLSITINFYSNNSSTIKSKPPLIGEDEHKVNPIHWSSELSPNGIYKADSFTFSYNDRYNYYQVLITHLRTGKVKRIYSGDFHTMDTEWTKDNKIKISYDCGTGCLSTRIIDLNEHVLLVSDRSNKWITETFKSY